MSYPKAPYKLRKEDDILYMADIMLRWPHKSYIKICRELFYNRLIPHILVEKFYDTSTHERYCKTIKFKPEYITFDIHIRYFDSIVFTKKNIEKIETPIHTMIPNRHQHNEKFEICTKQNIQHLAPQLLYTICLHANKRFFKVFDEDQIRNTMHSNDVNPCITLSEKDRHEWIIKHEHLWARFNSEAQKQNAKTKCLDPIQTFIDEHKKAGICDCKQLAQLVDSFFPNHLTDRELGVLLPACPGRSISFEAERKRGQRLRGVI